MLKTIVVLGLIVVILLAPFCARDKLSNGEKSSANQEILVVITPHNDSIRREFALAFQKYMAANFNKNVRIDWRTPGGTSEISKYLNSSFRYAFENEWKNSRHHKNHPLDAKIISAFSNAKIRLTDKAADDNAEQLARRFFLNSDIGVGIDVFFGGGEYDFSSQARKGFLVAKDKSGKNGLAVLAEQSPEIFSDEIIPLTLGGEKLRDEQMRWCGAALATFGIVSNMDVLRQIGINEPIDNWRDLGKYELFGKIALADPTKSGSVTKAFEMIIQQEMLRTKRTKPLRLVPGKSKLEAEKEIIAEGWTNALNLIQRISANARYFADSATKIPLDVAQGNAAAGMCIDFYGRVFAEMFQDENGDSPLVFRTPRGGSSVGADPIAMLRGAPNPDLAHQFLKFVISEAGQKIWNYRVGVAGGPEKIALRRLPIRKDFYTEKYQQFFSDADENPYAPGNLLKYNKEWTGELFGVIRQLIKIMCIDNHDDLRTAWQAINENGRANNEIAQSALEDTNFSNYYYITGSFLEMLRGSDEVVRITKLRSYANIFRKNYRTALRNLGIKR